MINIADVQALIAFAILNNKSGLINAMNAYGHPVSNDISDAELYNAVSKAWQEDGISELKNILSRVPLDKSKITEEQAKNLAIKYNGVDPNAKKIGDFLNSLGQGIGDFLSGTTVVNQNPNLSTQSSEPVLPAWVVPTTAIISMAVIAFLFARNVKNALGASIAIGIVAISVIIYGTFAKKTTTNVSGGGGTSTTHNGALGWLQGILDGFHLNVIGAG